MYAANTMAFVATAGGYSSMSSRLTGSINTYYEARSRGVKSVRNMFAPDDTKDKDKDA